MKGAKQTTLREQVAVSGIGVHSGLPVTLTLHPADADTGIVFLRVDADGRPSARSAPTCAPSPPPNSRPCWATPRARCARPPSTCWRRCAGSASTTPSSRSTAPKCRSWTAARPLSSRRSIRPASTARALPRRFIKVLKPVRVAKGDAFGELRPYEHGFRVEAEIEFDHPLIGRQALALDVEPETFRREIARARTFGFMQDVAQAVERGLRARRLVREHAGGHRRPRAQPGRLALRRRVRAPQGARRDRRSGACRRAAARRLPVGPRRPQAQPCGAVAR